METTLDDFDVSGMIIFAIAQIEKEQEEAGEEVLGATQDQIVERMATFSSQEQQEAAVIASRLRVSNPDLFKEDEKSRS